MIDNMLYKLYESFLHKLPEACINLAHKLLKEPNEFLGGLLGRLELHLFELVEEWLGLVGQVRVHDLVGRFRGLDDGFLGEFVVVDDAAHHTGSLC